MDIHVLDKDYNSLDLVQDFESFIWTDRYSGYGDFELVVAARSRWLLAPDHHIHIKESDHLMIIDSYEKMTNDDSGKDLMKVVGRSGEALLDNRLVTPSRSTEPWTREGFTPENIATWLVDKICVRATGFSAMDAIENLTLVAPDPSGVEIDVEFENSKTLYEAVKELCDSADLGFRMHYKPDSKNYTFKVYKGTDRRGSNVIQPLIFDERFETLYNTKWLKSTHEHKNVAYVSHSDRSAHRVVYPRNMAVPTGRRRKVLFVNANDIENLTNAKLDQRGREELAKHNVVDLFDGEAIPSTTMVYNQNYFMGDIGTLRDNEGNERDVIVAEHTWTYDSNGLRSYPTFKTLEG